LASEHENPADRGRRDEGRGGAYLDGMPGEDTTRVVEAFAVSVDFVDATARA